jgi:TrmH RNA methyltransferase
MFFCYIEGTMLNKLTNELAVCGYNAVAALAEYHPEQINRLFLRQDRFDAFKPVCHTLAERKRPYKLCEDEELARICKSGAHQGVVAMIYEPTVEPLSHEDLAAWAEAGDTGLVLYQIGNDHNVGAIARSAAFFGAKWLVLAGDHPAPEGEHPASLLSTSAYRVAEGGMEHLIVRRVSNTAAFLRDASDSLFTLATDGRARLRISDLATVGRREGERLHREAPGLAIVLGNEERGLPQEVKNVCRVIMRIPGTGLMESLNVAQAATLFLHAWYEYRN